MSSTPQVITSSNQTTPLDLPIFKPYQYWSPFGFLLSIIGLAYKVEDKDHRSFYINKQGLVAGLVTNLGDELKRSALQSERVALRALEILNPVIGENVSLEKIEETAKKILSPEVPSLEKLIEKMETIRDAHLTHITLDLEQIKKTLKPGDLIFRKYHEDNPNPICDLQKYFRFLGFGTREREGYKFSHLAMYVGNGKMAEAVMPHESDPQVRVVSMDHARCSLDAKNQYWVARPKDSDLGQRAADVFETFATTFDDKGGAEGKDGGKVKLTYNYFEALRSLWHPTWFDYFAKVRYLKYHADHIDKTAPTHIVLPRQLYCSYAVSMAYQIADSLKTRENTPKTLKDIVGEPPTNHSNKWIRALIRGVWTRYHAIVNYKELNDFVTLKYDALRANPQDMRNYVMHHPELFEKEQIIIDSVK